MKASCLATGNKNAITVPVLAELISRGDGTFILRPSLATADLDTWVTIRQAAQILNLKPRSVYRLLGRYLVYRRALPTRIVVSLKSILALRQATQDPEFWDNPALQTKVAEHASRCMAQLAAAANE
jgi:hypothetical protein